jgi:hypothetical protein
LEIEIPDSQVLLSDYNNWHNVLNGWYNDNSMNRDEWEAEREWYRSLNGKEAEKALLESWERIFDVTPFECGDGWRRNACFVQATFWKFHLADVKKVQYLAVR